MTEGCGDFGDHLLRELGLDSHEWTEKFLQKVSVNVPDDMAPIVIQPWFAGAIAAGLVGRGRMSTGPVARYLSRPSSYTAVAATTAIGGIIALDGQWTGALGWWALTALLWSVTRSERRAVELGVKLDRQFGEESS